MNKQKRPIATEQEERPEQQREALTAATSSTKDRISTARDEAAAGRAADTAIVARGGKENSED